MKMDKSSPIGSAADESHVLSQPESTNGGLGDFTEAFKTTTVGIQDASQSESTNGDLGDYTDISTASAAATVDDVQATLERQTSNVELINDGGDHTEKSIVDEVEVVAHSQSTDGDPGDHANASIENSSAAADEIEVVSLPYQSTNGDHTATSSADVKKNERVPRSAEEEREELLDRFFAYCQRFRSVPESSSSALARQKFRLTDLLKWFVEDEGRPGPLTFRKRLEKTGFSLPSSISLPPSQVVDLIIETLPEKSLKEAFGNTGKTEETSESSAQRQHFARYAAPNMTRFLHDIGYGLVSEVAYRSILGKAVSELSSSSGSGTSEAGAVEKQAQMVDHIRRVYEDAKKQNQPFKPRLYRCPIDYCDFATETQLQLYEHQRKPHKKTHRWECALCMKFSSWNDEDMEEHYNFEHGFTSSAKWDLPSSRAPCPFCDQDFPYKGQMRNHLRAPTARGGCAMNVRNVKVTNGQDDADVLNLQLWPKAEERRVTTISGGLQQRKAQEHKLLPNIRPNNSGAPFSNRSGQPSGRVADVVSLVAAGYGQLRAPPRPTSGVSVSSNLPRLYPSTTALRSTQSVQQQRFINQQQQQQQLIRQIFLAQQQQLRPRLPSILTSASVTGARPAPTLQRASQRPLPSERFECEICDLVSTKKLDYLKHLQTEHRKLLDKSESDLIGAAPLACSRCRDRFYSYEGLERHLLMEHNLVTNELLSKAQKRQDSGKCRVCNKIYAFNLLQHLVQDHQRTLCSAEIVYSCDVCHFQCNSYVQLELHLQNHHRDNSGTTGLKTNFGNTVEAPNYGQASATLPVISPRPQSAVLTTQQPPRSGQLPNRLTAQPQSAAAILSAALNNNKRPAASSARLGSHMERPPKLMKMSEAAPSAVNSKSQQRIQPAPAPQQQQILNQRKLLRYCCTPCDLKFISYEAVLKHWVERHLKPLRVPLCRIDKCESCQQKLTLERRKENGPGDAAPEMDDGTAEGPSTSAAAAAAPESNALILDLELPELTVDDQLNEDDDVEVLSMPPNEIICLD